jgi:hypothetical protein
MSTIPLVMTAAGPVPTSPDTLRQNLLNDVAAQVADYTAQLPALLIEDISSTDVGALVTIDQARVDAVNSITPYGANAFILAQQGLMLGIPQGAANNTSVYIVFTDVNAEGYVIPAGFVVGDGTYQYVVQDGGIIGTGGSSPPLLAVANQSGSWAVAPNTVTQILTSLPSPYNSTMTVTNPQSGTPASSAETVQGYRARIMQANQVAGQGTPAYIRTLLQKVSGVTPRLVSVIQSTFGWEVICGGSGDPYSIALAIYQGVIDLSTIVGSNTVARNISVTIIDPPNQYTLTYVNPPQQVVTVSAIWNTRLTNFTAGAQVNQLAAPAIQNYINSIIVGQPINLLAMENAFQSAVSSVLSIDDLTTLTFTVTINGSVATPEAGTSMILSDPESYFFASDSAVTVVQG